MNTAEFVRQPDPHATLYKALQRAAPTMGLTMASVGEVIAQDRTTMSRTKHLDPNSKPGELAIMLLRCYRSLFALMGGNLDHVRHFMLTENRSLRGVPAEQIKTVEGLAELTRYLDALRGKA